MAALLSLLVNLNWLKEDTMKVVYNRLLGGWYIVRGAHQTPISGRFDSKEAALKHLRIRNPMHIG